MKTGLLISAIFVLTACGKGESTRERLEGYISDRVGWTKEYAGEVSEKVRNYVGVRVAGVKKLSGQAAEDGKTYIYEHGGCSAKQGDSCNDRPRDGKDGKDGKDGESITGPAGEKGDKGDKGDQGETGPQGNTGDTGATGATGATGPQGEQGDAGATGPQGNPGNPGNNGTSCLLSKVKVKQVLHYCWYDYYISCSNGSVRILENEKESCNQN